MSHTYAYTLGTYAIQNEKQVSIGESTCRCVVLCLFVGVCVCDVYGCVCIMKCVCVWSICLKLKTNAS
ncbi:hypothetical protein EON63_02370 [archaeon]|nr:MAG: hypothetical protein EON63_02370 [archaeon]